MSRERRPAGPDVDARDDPTVAWVDGSLGGRLRADA
jgi:hypothetical protein